jgi:uncharacterized membrane protein (UPF0127 family)
MSVARTSRCHHRFSLFAVVALLGVWAVQVQAAPQTRLVIEGIAGPHIFQVELAATEKERQVGLMYRRKLARDAGMLFDYLTPQPVAMWMKNTYIPLDMLFIAADGRVVNIAKRTVPHSLASIASAGRVRAVLELSAGTTDRLDIKPGDLVRHRVFGNLADQQ